MATKATKKPVAPAGPSAKELAKEQARLAREAAKLDAEREAAAEKEAELETEREEIEAERVSNEENFKKELAKEQDKLRKAWAKVNGGLPPTDTPPVDDEPEVFKKAREFIGGAPNGGRIIAKLYRVEADGRDKVYLDQFKELGVDDLPDLDDRIAKLYGGPAKYKVELRAAGKIAGVHEVTVGAIPAASLKPNAGNGNGRSSGFVGTLPPEMQAVLDEAVAIKKRDEQRRQREELADLVAQGIKAAIPAHLLAPPQQAPVSTARDTLVDKAIEKAINPPEPKEKKEDPRVALLEKQIADMGKALADQKADAEKRDRERGEKALITRIDELGRKLRKPKGTFGAFAGPVFEATALSKALDQLSHQVEEGEDKHGILAAIVENFQGPIIDFVKSAAKDAGKAVKTQMEAAAKQKAEQDAKQAAGASANGQQGAAPATPPEPPYPADQIPGNWPDWCNSVFNDPALGGNRAFVRASFPLYRVEMEALIRITTGGELLAYAERAFGELGRKALASVKPEQTAELLRRIGNLKATLDAVFPPQPAPNAAPPPAAPTPSTPPTQEPAAAPTPPAAQNGAAETTKPAEEPAKPPEAASTPAPTPETTAPAEASQAVPEVAPPDLKALAGGEAAPAEAPATPSPEPEKNPFTGGGGPW